MSDDVNQQPTPEPDATASRRPSRRTGIIAALLAVLVAVVAVGAVVLTSGGGSEADPEQAVRDYDRVFKEADCDAFNDLTTSSFRTELGLTTCDKFDANAKDGSIATFKLTVQSSDVDGDTSSVRTRETFTSSTGEQSIDLIYSLVKDGGDWKVDGIAANKGT